MDCPAETAPNRYEPAFSVSDDTYIRLAQDIVKHAVAALPLGLKVAELA
jgi:hypothetical protein